jgi:hypothetical protein
MLAAWIAGEAATGRLTVNNGYVVTPAYWEVFGGLLVALAVTVALAVVNGERHHGRYSYVVEQR